MKIDGLNVDGFLLPGHVSVIIDIEDYRSPFEQFRIPCVISGFEWVDILQSIHMLITQIESGNPRLENGYPQVVSSYRNRKAQQLIQEVFETVDTAWRGIGTIPGSGLEIRETFAEFDAREAFELKIPDAPEPKGGACADILTGLKTPPDCLSLAKIPSRLKS